MYHAVYVCAYVCVCFLPSVEICSISSLRVAYGLHTQTHTSVWEMSCHVGYSVMDFFILHTDTLTLTLQESVMTSCTLKSKGAGLRSPLQSHTYTNRWNALEQVQRSTMENSKIERQIKCVFNGEKRVPLTPPRVCNIQSTVCKFWMERTDPQFTWSWGWKWSVALEKRPQGQSNQKGSCFGEKWVSCQFDLIEMLHAKLTIWPDIGTD